MAAATATAWAFEPWGLSHQVMLVLFLAGLVPAALLGRRCRDHPVGAGRALALVLVAFLLPLQLIDHLPANFDRDTSLPLQLCDLAAVAAVIALWTRRRTPVAVTYYWGLLLTPQALLTPALASEFPDPKFLTFWGMHLLIVWAAVFLTFGLGVRPDWRGLGWTVAITACWMAAMYPLNLALGTNYGFVNAKPTTGSILDLFGPWPVYLLVEVLVVAVAWSLMTWPWTRRRARRTAPTGAAGRWATGDSGRPS